MKLQERDHFKNLSDDEIIVINRYIKHYNKTGRTDSSYSCNWSGSLRKAVYKLAIKGYLTHTGKGQYKLNLDCKYLLWDGTPEQKAYKQEQKEKRASLKFKAYCVYELITKLGYGLTDFDDMDTQEVHAFLLDCYDDEA